MFRQPQIQGVKKSNISWYAKCTFVLKGFAKFHFKISFQKEGDLENEN